MIDFSNFSRILDDVGGIDRAARLDLIDRFDALRKASGRVEAFRWLNGLKDASLLHRVRRVAVDQAAQRAIDGILERNDPREIKRMEARLSEDMIADCARWIGMSEEKIVEQAADLKERRHMRRVFKRSVAMVNIALKVVGGGKGEFQYCTPFETEIRKQQTARLKKWAEERVIVKKGSRRPLIKLVENQVKHELAELHAFSKGLEKYAKTHGKDWTFWTLTAPGVMHGNPLKGKNRWDGTSPLKAHRWIAEMWKKVEARARMEGVVISGFRVVEPQQDGTPHWHLLAFADKQDLDTLERLIRSQPGAPSWASYKGAKVVEGKDNLSKASSYLFKYLKKTLDGDSSPAAAAADAWRAAWGIRGIQCFGLPPKGLWRAFRDLKVCPLDPLLEKCWIAAHAGDGEAFIRLTGGLNIKKKDRPVQYNVSKNEIEMTKTVAVKNEETGKQYFETSPLWTILKSDDLEKINEILLGEKLQKIEVKENHPRGLTPHTPDTEGLEYLIIDPPPLSNIHQRK